MDKKDMSFENAMEQLEQVVDQMENQSNSLDQSMKLFQKGIELSDFCNKKLEEYEKKISLLVENNEGEFEEKPFEE